MIEISDARFAELVDAAVAGIPAKMRQEISNVAFLIEEEHPTNPNILGLYHGVALPRRTHNLGGKLPDTITLYRESIKRRCHSEAQLEERVRKVVLHEIGHYFGLDDAELHRLGY